MSLIASPVVLGKTKHAELSAARDLAERYGDTDRVLDTTTLGIPALNDLMNAAKKAKDIRTVRALESILLGRKGKFDQLVPNFSSFHDVLLQYLKHEAINGWLYGLHRDGFYYPYLVTKLQFHGENKRDCEPASVDIWMSYYGRSSGGRTQLQTRKLTFRPQSVVRKRISDVLADVGFFKETPQLAERHDATMERYFSTVQNAFAIQFRFTGTTFQYETSDRGRERAEMARRKVIHDLDADSRDAFNAEAESPLLGAEACAKMPVHSVVYVFDLGSHEWYWVHSDTLTAYEYDNSLRGKLILPKSHRDLLDVLTTDLGAFVDDFVEGKAAGNIILCKGDPGLGKTLTAEVYAELTQKALYRIHSGQLGTTPSEIERGLAEVFRLTKRWGVVALLDECDVFVAKRGNDLVQNAVVAEFLRTTEYFDGILFLNTNRPGDIDPAFISRCAAIIEYKYPTPDDLRSIWKVMAEQFGTSLDSSLLDELLLMFPRIAARDVKNLFRLALRVAAREQAPLSADVFRQVAVFRGLSALRDEEQVEA
ncbi:hypothetical protein Q042_05264 [Pseudomonas aeruginosa BWHPSA037]|uniref:AAA family ATPase n=1 Tax=Pseudomonas aeruginosa TaxID=287 RepID=UPI00044BEC5D|nr:ATP-binding protein [Pseudomonas aeruginosa]ETV55855.1 hypothetical protein Q042_05264 [Pseudomonas aeruginosa BWHPSA037]